MEEYIKRHQNKMRKLHGTNNKVTSTDQLDGRGEKSGKDTSRHKSHTLILIPTNKL